MCRLWSLIVDPPKRLVTTLRGISWSAPDDYSSISTRAQTNAHHTPSGHRSAPASHYQNLQPCRESLKRSDRSHDDDQTPILFYDRDQPFYEFTNFSNHAVMFHDKIYPTSEHLFQAMKFIKHSPEIAEEIRNLPTSRAALQTATRYARLRRADWFQYNIRAMDMVLEAKFTQHAALLELLMSTGNRELVEASPIDSFWGFGEDGKGRNELGKALMRLREKLRVSGKTVRE